jgi:hypothetical protein
VVCEFYSDVEMCAPVPAFAVSCAAACCRSLEWSAWQSKPVVLLSSRRSRMPRRTVNVAAAIEGGGSV